MFLLYSLMGLLGFGIADLLVSYISKSLGYIKGMLWNTILMTIPLFLLVFFTGSSLEYEKINDLTIYSILISAFFHTLGGLSFYKGTTEGRLSILAPISSCYSLIIILLSVLIFDEVLTTMNLVSIFVIVFGTILITTNLNELKNLKIVITDKSIPYGIGAMVFWGIGFTALSYVTKEIGWLFSNIFTTLVSIFILAIITLIKEKSFFPKNISSYFLAATLGFFTTMGYLGYALGSQYGLSSIVAPIVAAAPLVTVTLALIFLKDRLSKIQVIGILITVLGIVYLSV